MEVYEEIRRGRSMSCEALRELFKYELKEAYSSGEEKGEVRGKGAAQREIIIKMKSKGYSTSQISELFNMDPEDIEKII